MNDWDTPGDRDRILRDIDFSRASQRSSAITSHDQLHCVPCQGAGKQQKDHYALGRMRLRLGAALALTAETTQVLNFQELLDRYREAGFLPLLGK